MATNIFNSTPCLPGGTPSPAVPPWAKGISDTFLKFGWIKAVDTGQIDWTKTAAIPPSGELEKPIGYEIWGMGDSFQATCPCFVKVEYGIQWQSNYYGRYKIYLTIGTSTDGTGNLTGTISTREAMVTEADGSLNNSNSYIYGNTSTFSAAMWAGRNGPEPNQWLFSIERLRDKNGIITDKGILFTVFCSRHSNPLTTILYKDTRIQQRYIPSPYSQPTYSLGDSNRVVHPIPWQAWAPDGMFVQVLGSLYHYIAVDLPSRFVPLNMKVLGVNHKYLPLAYPLNGGNSFQNGAHCTIKLNQICTSFLLRWE